MAKVAPVKERVRLEFLDFDVDKAHAMVDLARAWVVGAVGSETGPGIRNGTVYVICGDVPVVAYWTEAREVVVRELAPDDAP